MERAPAEGSGGGGNYKGKQLGKGRKQKGGGIISIINIMKNMIKYNEKYLEKVKNLFEIQKKLLYEYREKREKKDKLFPCYLKVKADDIKITGGSLNLIKTRYGFVNKNKIVGGDESKMTNNEIYHLEF